MKIMRFMRRIPGGIMIVPLFLGAIMNTFIPNATKIGGLTTSLFSSAGTNTLIALALFVTGTQVEIKKAPVALGRSFVLLVTKFLAGLVIGLAVGKIFGPAGFLGISTLACFSAITNSNGGLFVALNLEYGDQTDVITQSLLSINDGPFLALVACGASGLASIPIQSLVASIIPLVLGCLLGNLDKEFSEYLAPMHGKVTMFFAFCLGQTIDLRNAWKAGLGGVILAVFVVLGSGIPLILADKFINRRPGYCGAAASSAAGNSVATPALVAEVDPSLAAMVPGATAAISAAVVLTAILTPMLTNWVAKKWGCPKFDREKAAAAAEAVPVADAGTLI